MSSVSRIRRVEETGSGRRVNWAGVWNSATTSYYLVVSTTVTLVVLGLVMVLSSSSVESMGRNGTVYSMFVRQLEFAIGGFVLLAVASRLPTAFLKRFAWMIFTAAVVLQLLIFTPLNARSGGVLGNNNWFAIPGTSLTVQPSEFIKLALAILLGTVLSRTLASATSWLHVLIPAGGASVLAVGMVMLGNDLGTALVIALLIAACFFVAGIPIKWVAWCGGAGAVVIAGFVLFSTNRIDRIKAAYDSTCDTSDRLCYQVIRGIEGLGSGGFAGVGLGSGSEKWKYLPEAQNDFIFSVIGEELGFIGTVLVIILFLLLGVGMVRIVIRHDDPMVKIATAGIAAWIVGQAFINIGVVTRLLPVIGIPLPMVSNGGSALVATMLAMGVVISFARTEPGAREAFAAKPSMVRRTIAVISHSGRRIGRSS